MQAEAFAAYSRPPLPPPPSRQEKLGVLRVGTSRSSRMHMPLRLGRATIHT